MSPVAPLETMRVSVSFENGKFIVRDYDGMGKLWKSGFFGTGNLSRSEPTWKERVSSGEARFTMEFITKIRREERKKFKQLRSQIQKLETKSRDESLSASDASALIEMKEELSEIKKFELKDLTANYFQSREEQAVQLSEGMEFLQLLSEEVFFLRFALNVVDIRMSLMELFHKCCSTSSILPNNDFILNYVVYHHFRSLGWCVRTGIKFGCNFLLYKKGPPFGHAPFAILIMTGKDYTWIQLSAIARVIGAVKKSLVLIYVDTPSIQSFNAAIENSDKSDKSILYQIFTMYKVTEFLYRRWVPSRNRD